MCVFMYACAAEASTLFRIFYDGGLALHFPYPYPKIHNQTHTHHPHTKTCRHSSLGRICLGTRHTYRQMQP